MESITKNLWHKSISRKILDVNEKSRNVAMMLAGFNNVDEGRDMLIKGCFAKSLQEHGPESQSDRKIAYLWCHDAEEPIGHFTKIEESNEGLYAEAFVDEVEKGEQALKQYASGTLNQHSIGFSYIWDKIEYISDGDFFLVKEVKLFEGSVVPFGMNEKTPFLGFKSLAANADYGDEIEEMIKDIDPKNQIAVRKIIQKIISLQGIKPIKSLNPVMPVELNFEKLINNFKL